ncbi:unnamed protein product [Boreogadus saida]
MKDVSHDLSRLGNSDVHLFVAEDVNNQRFVSQTVVQQPVSASTQLGDPVALQCSITSQRTDHSHQCQREPSLPARGGGRTRQLIGQLRLAAIKLRPAQQARQDTDFMDSQDFHR